MLRTVFVFPLGLQLSVKRLVLRTAVVSGVQLSVKRSLLRISGIFLYRGLCDFMKNQLKSIIEISILLLCDPDFLK